MYTINLVDAKYIKEKMRKTTIRKIYPTLPCTMISSSETFIMTSLTSLKVWVTGTISPKLPKTFAHNYLNSFESGVTKQIP
jgi:hypothetical protein